MIAYDFTYNSAYYCQSSIPVIYANNYWPRPLPSQKKKAYDPAKLTATPIQPPCEPPVLAVLPRRAPRPQARQRALRPVRSRPGMKGRV